MVTSVYLHDYIPLSKGSNYDESQLLGLTKKRKTNLLR